MACISFDDLEVNVFCPACSKKISLLILVDYKTHNDDPTKVTITYDKDRAIKDLEGHVKQCTG